VPESDPLVHAITNSGWVEVITGCMFSGKTEELLRRLRRAEIAGQEVAAFTPNVDARFGTAAIGSYVGRRIEADVIDTEDPLPGMREALNGESIVAVDEVNFFSEALLDACDELADDGRRVRGRRSTGRRLGNRPDVPRRAVGSPPRARRHRGVRRQAPGHLHPLWRTRDP
jgi:hypothetical protein